MRIGLIFAVMLVAAASFAKTRANSAATWTVLARRVGFSEEYREAAVRELRSMRGLDAQLSRALTTDDRPLALEVITDLNLRQFVPRMISLVPSDEDGFLTLAVNSMMTEANRPRVLSLYSDLLSDWRAHSVGSIVAMLEPLGRLGKRLPRTTLVALKSHPSPDVRDATLYYLRMMSLRHGSTDNVDLVDALTHDSTVQVRDHARDVQAELRAITPVVSR